MGEDNNRGSEDKVGKQKERDRGDREKEERDRRKDRNKKEEERRKKKEERERLKREDVLYVGYLGIWPVIAGIEEKIRD